MDSAEFPKLRALVQPQPQPLSLIPARGLSHQKVEKQKDLPETHWFCHLHLPPPAIGSVAPTQQLPSPPNMAEYLQKFLGGAKSAVSSASTEVDAGMYCLHPAMSQSATSCVSSWTAPRAFTDRVPACSRLRRFCHRRLARRSISRCVGGLFCRCHPGI